MSEHHTPLSQFELKNIYEFKLAGIDVSFTNSTLYMVIATAFVSLLLIAATSKRSLIPSRLQVISESMYHFINGMVGGSLGDSQLFPRIFAFIFTLFFFIASCNLFGITPYSYTVTSQIVVTFTIALISFLLVVFLGIKTHGLFGFIHMFAPKGVPMFMLPLIFLIELFSFLIRPVTLAVRLFANMVAGHVLLKVVAGFIIALGLAGVFPFLFTILLIGFEVFVAILQAYIFSILVCAYLGEVVKEH